MKNNSIYSNSLKLTTSIASIAIVCLLAVHSNSTNNKMPLHNNGTTSSTLASSFATSSPRSQSQINAYQKFNAKGKVISQALLEAKFEDVLRLSADVTADERDIAPGSVEEAEINALFLTNQLERIVQSPSLLAKAKRNPWMAKLIGHNDSDVREFEELRRNWLNNQIASMGNWFTASSTKSESLVQNIEAVPYLAIGDQYGATRLRLAWVERAIQLDPNGLYTLFALYQAQDSSGEKGSAKQTLLRIKDHPDLNPQFKPVILRKLANIDVDSERSQTRSR